MNKIINSLKTTKSLIITLGLTTAVLFAVIMPSITSADVLYRQLQLGSRGADVSSLQTFLAEDPTIYPQGKVTGYFGSLTKSAVSNFQARNGIATVGRVGPSTLPVINEQMANGSNSSDNISAPIITSAGVNNITRNSATINWYTNENAKGLVYFSTSPLSLGEHPNSVDVSGNTAMVDSNYRTNQSVTLQNLQPNTTYYYLAYVTGISGRVSITWPATFTTSN
jgi:peptidoglycan hydrolase-like protein with peptidoglycan-binding domain